VDEDTLYHQALAAIEAGDRETARRLLAELVRRNARHEQGWLRLASVVDNRSQIVDCLQRVLALNPHNLTARDWLEQAQQPAKKTSELRAALTAQMLDDDVQLAEPGDDERPVPRLGQYLLDYQFISAEQLKAALVAQRVSISSGRARRLGDILLEQGALSPDRLDFAVREQHRSFYSLFDE
jgi:thioredoxin-like negative regulator of GroEL